MTEETRKDRHLELLQSALEQARQEGAGQASPHEQRDLEQDVRKRVVDLAGDLADSGCGSDEAAHRLGVNPRTLRFWEREFARDNRITLLPGRPARLASADERRDVVSYLNDVGPGVGVPTLRLQFPSLARAELTDLLGCYRDLWRAQHPRLLHVLRWQRPGTVWAVDFAYAPRPVDGVFDYLLAVRDLASGQQLLWQPVTAMTAEAAMDELQWLFTRHGAPLVLKMDNGSAFIDARTQRLLRQWKVHSLFSPPHTPSYNGSIEAAIGAMKRRTERLAAMHGHPLDWTSALLEAAQRQANETPRRRLSGATPEESWSGRVVPSCDVRERFGVTVEACRTEARRERGLCEWEDHSRQKQASLDREAIRRALVAHDLLLFRRRRITPRIPRPKTAR